MAHPKLTPAQRNALQRMAQAEDGTAGTPWGLGERYGNMRAARSWWGSCAVLVRLGYAVVATDPRTGYRLPHGGQHTITAAGILALGGVL